MFSEIFQPARIGNVSLKNRIIVAPMGDGLQTTDRDVSDAQIAYFARRAQGGAGLIFQNGLACCSFNILSSTVWLDTPARIARLCALTRAVHSYGAKMGIMLGGGFGYSLRGSGGTIPLSPSPTPLMLEPDVLSREMTTEQVQTLIADFARAARIAQRAGYDMITVQGYAGYLLDQFMTERWNQRTDRYGGSFENRMRLPREMIAAIREQCGPDYPVIWKMCASHGFPGGRTLDEGLEIARVLEDAGCAALQIDVGAYGVNSWKLIQPVYQMERMEQFEAAAAVKRVVGIPVFTQGKVGDPAEAEAVFREGKTDFVVLGRSFLADPDWPRKVREDRVEDIVPCICCLDGCLAAPNSHAPLDEYNEDSPVYCAVNPLCGQEAHVRVLPVETPKRVLVVGAGPAGMEAAVVAADRGCQVELWERSTRLGGALLQAAAPANKRELRRLLAYFTAQIYKRSDRIRLRLNREADADGILAAAPDRVILAVGGRDIRPAVPGMDGPGVYTVSDILPDRHVLGERTVVVGGGFVGCEAAMHLGFEGKRVTLLEMRDDILLEHGAIQSKGLLRQLLQEYGVRCRTGAKLVAVENGEAVAEIGGVRERIPFDALVCAVGKRSDHRLMQALLGRVDCVEIGDAAAPGKVLNAIWDGFSAAIAL